jgi:hypothetical protein
MTDIDTGALEASLEDLNSKIEKLKEEAGEKSQTYIKAVFDQFFKDTPEIEAVQWQQYTPYFNFGGACEFRVHDPQFRVAKSMPIDDEEHILDDSADDEEDIEFEENTKFDKPPEYVYKFAAEPRQDKAYYQGIIDKYEDTVKIIGEARVHAIQANMEKIFKMFGQVKDVYFEVMFGDHVVVTAQRSGITVDEYDHD